MTPEQIKAKAEELYPIQNTLGVNMIREGFTEGATWMMKEMEKEAMKIKTLRDLINAYMNEDISISKFLEVINGKSNLH